ncbi:metallophosphoesterase [Metabacillus lacus]|nr:metallophosphoesterase [Metabacillus lacus]
MKYVKWLLCLEAILLLCSFPSSSNAYNQKPFTFVWMTDTQYYAKKYPEILQKQLSWIVNNRESEDIRYVLHTGDLVHNATDPLQWERAHLLLRMLDAEQIPYGVLPGNHDLEQQQEKYQSYYYYFGEHRFNSQASYGGSYQNNYGHYDLLEAGDTQFLIVHMGWKPTKNSIKWMNDILKSHREAYAILAFHDYVSISGRRSKDGEKLFQKVVKKNENVKLVLSGHYYGNRELVTDVEGRKVYQLLSNFQAFPRGGKGYMRLLTFDPVQKLISIKTYSPYLSSGYKEHLQIPFENLSSN